MNYAEEIKTRLTAREVFEFYGFPVNRAGFVCCPLHGEKTPSLRVYDGTRGWKCFGCGKGSSIVDFVMFYFGLSFADAQKKLNDDFQLGLPIGQQLSRQDRIAAQQKAAERKKQVAERQKRIDALRAAYDAALSEFVRLDTIIDRNAPTSPAEAFGGAWAYAITHIDGAWYSLCEADTNLRDYLRICYRN